MSGGPIHYSLFFTITVMLMMSPHIFIDMAPDIEDLCLFNWSSEIDGLVVDDLKVVGSNRAQYTR